MRLLLIFVGLFYVAFLSVAQSSVLVYDQSGMGQIAYSSVDDCDTHLLENLADSQCNPVMISGIDDTNKTSQNGDENTKICLVHAIAMESSTCIEPATQKQIPIFTRRLVALQPFSIKKPPRLIS